MTSKRIRLVTGVLMATVLSAPLAMALASRLTFNSLQGTLHVVQRVPCGGLVDLTTTIAGGRMDITPLQQHRGDPEAQFELARLSLFVTPFTLQHECLGVTATAEFREIGIRLASTVRFSGQPIGIPEDRQYRFSIPKNDVLLFASVLDNLPVKQPETQYRRPSEDVTGVIDLRRNTAQLHVVLASNLRFRVGCVDGRCLIDERAAGTQTADITAAIVSPSGR
jgi:hypothetical protein